MVLLPNEVPPGFRNDLLAALKETSEQGSVVEAALRSWLIAGGLATVIGGAGVVAGVVRHQRKRSA